MSRLVQLASRAGEASGAFLRELGKARGLTNDGASQNVPDPISTFIEPMANNGMGYMDHHLGTFDVLRRVRDQLPPVGAVIETRVKQLLPFSRPSRNKYDTGFKISLRDEKAKATTASEKRAEELTRYVEHCGHPDARRHRDGFPAYMSKVGADALLLAQDSTEVVPDRKGVPAAFYAVDASTIRIAAEGGLMSDAKVGDQTAYVQLIDGMVKTRYTRDQLIFGVTNPTSDIRFKGYGVSPVERAMRVCAAMLHTWEANTRQYQGVTSRGVFNLKKANSRMLSDFRQRMQMWMQGVENTATVPCVSLDDGLEFIDLTRTMQDMQFAQWWNVLLRLLCAYFCIEPSEVNFEMAQVGLTNTLSTPSNEGKIIESRERGLAPLLAHFSTNLNAHIIHKLDPDFALEFVGLDAMTREQRQQYNAARVQSTHTLNEIRAEEDLPELPPEEGDIILNGAYLQNKMQVAQAAQMAAQQAQYPAPDTQDADGEPGTAPTQADDPPGDDATTPQDEPLRRSYRWTLEA